MSTILSALLVGLILHGGSTVEANARRLVKSGFQDQQVQRLNFGFPTGFDWTPDGRLVVLEKRGIVWIYEDFENNANRIKSIDLTDVMCDNSERGLAGVAIHPDFKTNHYIYLYYTYNKNNNCLEDAFIGPVNRISRFVLDDSSKINLSTETVLLETPPLEYDHHNSGDLVFGKDGLLYATIGDGGSHQTFVSQDNSNLFGTIVRITDDGDIPVGNPYTFENGVQDSSRCLTGRVLPGATKCQEIYANGLRNPFRFAMDPNTSDNKVRFFINDVGQAAWEEISEGGDDHLGANYGWPYREGPCENNKKKNCATDPRYADPIHFYMHGGSSCVTAGSFVPNGVWPVEYDGAYLYAEYVKDKIWITTEGENGCQSCNPPRSSKNMIELTEYPRIISMKFGPYGNARALYYTSAANDGQLRRISYVGTGNYSPNASVISSSTSIVSGEIVYFDGSSSSDANGDSLSFTWDINGSQQSGINRVKFSYAFLIPGLYQVRLKVSDGRGGEDSSTIEVSVGHKPVPIIESIPINATFAVGDILILKGSATDEEDGTLSDSSLSWEVRQHHDTHFHPFLEATFGNNIQLQSAPAPEDYDAATNSFLEVLMTATDSDGLSRTVSRMIQPRKVLVQLETTPPGLELILDGLRVTTPITATSWESHKLQVIAPFQYSNETPYAWKAWSDGKEQKHNIIIPPAISEIPKYAAEFERYSGISFPTAAPTDEPVRIIGLLQGKREFLLSGDSKVFPEHNLTFTQQTNGNIVLTRGDDIVWETGVKSSSGKYFTYINGVSKMMTKRGTPAKRGGNVWVTKTEDNSEGDYFLGLNPDDSVSIYGGKSSNPGFEVWNSISGVVAPGTETRFPVASPVAKPPSSFAPAPTTVGQQEEDPNENIYLIMNMRTKVYDGTEVNSIPSGYTFRQYSNGRAALFKGEFAAWDRDGMYTYQEGSWFTSLQGDCNFLIKQEVTSDWPTRWKTQTYSDRCFLGVLEGKDGVMRIGVIEGDIRNSGNLLWSDPIKVEPTPAPSLALSLSPSALPSLSPTAAPTWASTSQPTLSLTMIVPSLSPTATSSSSPTKTNSVPPSKVHSILPTIFTSTLPTTFPTILPSLSPSTNPSLSPTAVPSLSPTTQPSLLPTIVPSLSPTTTPSWLPSKTNSAQPSIARLLPSPGTPISNPTSSTTAGIGHNQGTHSSGGEPMHTSQTHHEDESTGESTPNLEWSSSSSSDKNIFETTDDENKGETKNNNPNNMMENPNIPQGFTVEVVSTGNRNSILFGFHGYYCLWGMLILVL